MLQKISLYSLLLIISTFTFCSPPKEHKFGIDTAINALQKEQFSEILEALQSGWNINQADSLGNTLLHYAVSFAEPATLLRLLENRADPFYQNHEEISPLNKLVELGESEKVALIKNYVYTAWNNKEEGKWDDYYFETALENDIEKIIHDFIAHGKDINTPTSNKDLPPLVQAVFAGSYEATALLLKNGAHPDIDFDTRPVITISTLFGDIAITQLLVEHGAVIDTFDGPKNTPLQFAAEEGYVELVRFLLEKGADKNLKDIHGETALDKAIKNNHLSIVELLEKK